MANAQFGRMTKVRVLILVVKTGSHWLTSFAYFEFLEAAHWSSLIGLTDGYLSKSVS